MRLYPLIHDPQTNTAKRGDLLIESEHPEAIEAVIKALKLTSYIVDRDVLAAALAARVHRLSERDHRYGEYVE